jgi:hypothetical protein
LLQRRDAGSQPAVLALERGASTTGDSEVLRHADEHWTQAVHAPDQLSVLRDQTSGLVS